MSRSLRQRWPYFLGAFFLLFLFGSWRVDWGMYHRYVFNPEWETTRDFQAVKHAQVGRANATFVFLARNNEIDGVISTLWEIEDSFNSRYHYPYVFLNDVPFSDEFKRRTNEVISSSVTYGIIPPEHWNQPADIDEDRASRAREQMVKDKVDYGGSVSYRNMCRFNSGFFFRHELLQQYRYYWRIEPHVKFYCHLPDDPLEYMQKHDKTYGFTISLYEFDKTIPTLWNTTKEFMHKYPQYIPQDNAMRFLSDDGGETYNKCHYWSNFEIADMDFWRSEAYMKYFEYLDSKGGFYYERWGDAPVHSIAASLLLHKEKIHFFDQIGYRHHPFEHCPQGWTHRQGQCKCLQSDNFDYNGYSCKSRYDDVFRG